MNAPVPTAGNRSVQTRTIRNEPKKVGKYFRCQVCKIRDWETKTKANKCCRELKF